MYKILLNIVWAIVTVLILLVGFYFIWRLKKIPFQWKEMLHSFSKDNNSKVSVFETLSLSLGAKIGVGSLSGIALAIYLGGPGTIFWIWIFSFLSAAICFAESTLGSIYKVKQNDGSFEGGPSYYLKNGLHFNKWAITYSILIILAYIGSFLPIQVNTMVKSVQEVFSIPGIWMLLWIIIAYIWIVFGKKNKLYKFIAMLVPIMGILYIGIGLVVMILNYSLIDDVFLQIIQSAFSFHSISGGILYTMMIGLQRSVFSNESGVGTSAISSSLSDCEPIKQGYAQMSGVYITSFVICTITAFIILLSNYQDVNFLNLNGIELTTYAFSFHFGKIGKILLFIITCLFAFSTIIAGYYYGENALSFIFPFLKKKSYHLFKIITIFFLIIGAFISSNFLWNSVDLLVGLLSILNICSVFLLRKDIIYEYFHYQKALSSKKKALNEKVR